MKLQAKLSTGFDHTISILAIVAAVLLVLLMLFICSAVTTRYFLRQPIPGAIELSEYCLLFVTFLATAWVLREDGHVKMDLILSRLNPGNQVWLNIITSIVCAIICLILTWYGVKVTWEHFQIGHYQATVLRLPTSPILAIIPAGCFLLCIQFLRRAYGYLRTEKHQSQIK